jgi:hypothetical protein
MWPSIPDAPMTNIVSFFLLTKAFFSDAGIGLSCGMNLLYVWEIAE